MLTTAPRSRSAGPSAPDRVSSRTALLGASLRGGNSSLHTGARSHRSETRNWRSAPTPRKRSASTQCLRFSSCFASSFCALVPRARSASARATRGTSPGLCAPREAEGWGWGYRGGWGGRRTRRRQAHRQPRLVAGWDCGARAAAHEGVEQVAQDLARGQRLLHGEAEQRLPQHAAHPLQRRLLARRRAAGPHLPRRGEGQPARAHRGVEGVREHGHRRRLGVRRCVLRRAGARRAGGRHGGQLGQRLAWEIAARSLGGETNGRGVGAREGEIVARSEVFFRAAARRARAAGDAARPPTTRRAATAPAAPRSRPAAAGR